jgi:hypothetical protein
MTRKQLLRRAGIICCHFLRNLAFYKAGWRKGVFVSREQFWINANGNFLEICVLEWCKIFGNKSDRYYYEKIVSDKVRFYRGLLCFVGCEKKDFESYVKELKKYRDKFVAHLDVEKIMYIPDLRMARKSISYFYIYLLTHEEVDGCFSDAPSKMSKFYRHFLKLGRGCYPK